MHESKQIFSILLVDAKQFVFQIYSFCEYFIGRFIPRQNLLSFLKSVVKIYKNAFSKQADFIRQCISRKS